MTRRTMKTWAMCLVFGTRPHPYFVSAVYLLCLHAVSLIDMQVGGQPFAINMDAMAAGDAANAVVFTPENITLKTTLILLALELLAVVLHVGYQSFCLHAARLEKASFYDLMDGFIVFFKAIIVWVVTGVMVYFGTLLLIVPGLMLAYTYTMAPRLLLDHPDWGAFRCLRESRLLMHGHKWDYFLLRLSMIGWTILRAFPVTAVFAEPYATLCETVFYFDLIGDKSLDQIRTPPSDPDSKPPWEY